MTKDHGLNVSLDDYADSVTGSSYRGMFEEIP